MNKIDRREAILKTASLLGSAISAPTIFSLLYGCQSDTQKGDSTATQAVSADHSKMIAEIAELIIPKTTTPGAKEAKVPQFIEMMLVDCYSKEDQKRFYTGLDDLDEQADKTYGNTFLTCKPNEQLALLTKSEAEARSQHTGRDKKNLPFFLIMKELTLMGYFTSEIGATQALEYVSVPGRYEGCIDLKPGQKAWAT